MQTVVACNKTFCAVCCDKQNQRPGSFLSDWGPVVYGPPADSLADPSMTGLASCIADGAVGQPPRSHDNRTLAASEERGRVSDLAVTAAELHAGDEAGRLGVFQETADARETAASDNR